MLKNVKVHVTPCLFSTWLIPQPHLSQFGSLAFLFVCLLCFVFWPRDHPILHFNISRKKKQISWLTFPLFCWSVLFRCLCVGHWALCQLYPESRALKSKGFASPSSCHFSPASLGVRNPRTLNPMPVTMTLLPTNQEILAVILA